MNIEVTSPFPFEALPRIWRWAESFRDKIADDFGPKTLDEFMRFAAARWNQQKTWAISIDGELGGMIAFERLNPWLGTAHWLFKPDFQSKGVGLKASRIAVAEMFAEGIHKLCVYPLAGNHGMFSLLSQLGAKREAVLTGQTLCNGKPTDVWVYALTKEAFEAASPKEEVALCHG